MKSEYKYANGRFYWLKDRNMNYKLFAILIALSLTACAIDDNDLGNGENLIDTELQAFVDDFEAEALSRGYAIDIDALGVRVELADISQNNVAGACYHNRDDPGRIEIDALFYNRMTNLQREFVVFHELGHCVLGRDHSEAEFAIGTCQSLMASGTGTCRENYSNRTRTNYIDELFDNAE